MYHMSPNINFKINKFRDSKQKLTILTKMILKITWFSKQEDSRPNKKVLITIKNKFILKIKKFRRLFNKNKKNNNQRAK